MARYDAKFPYNEAFMRRYVKNPFVYTGLLITLGSGLLWLGAVVLERLKDAFPWFALFGVVLMFGGWAIELKKKKDGHAEEVTPPSSP
jgi:hypothetical protein